MLSNHCTLPSYVSIIYFKKSLDNERSLNCSTVQRCVTKKLNHDSLDSDRIVQHLDAHKFSSALVVHSNNVYIWKSTDNNNKNNSNNNNNNNSRNNNNKDDCKSQSVLEGVWSTYNLFPAISDKPLLLLSMDSICISLISDFPIWKFSFVSSNDQVLNLESFCWFWNWIIRLKSVFKMWSLNSIIDFCWFTFKRLIVNTYCFVSKFI